MNDDDLWEAIRAARPAPHHDPVPHALMERIAASDPATVGLMTLSPRRRRRWFSAGPVMAAITVCVALAVALAVLVGHGNSGSLSAAGKVPNGRPEKTAGGFAAIASTAKIVAQAPDPGGGLPWGLRMARTTRGQVCLDVGRMQNGTIGALGTYGAWANDHRFHAIPVGGGQGGLSTFCWVTDVRGDAFLNVTSDDTIANAAGQGAYDGSAHGKAAGTLLCPGSSRAGEEHFNRAKPCPPGALRDFAYGVLGPDAVSITYNGSDGQPVTERTSGPQGAYLIVALHAQCTSPAHPHGLSCPSLGSYGPTLSAGVITKVTYRDGRVCRLPAPHADGLVHDARCPLVGYQAPQTPHPTAAQLSAPVHVTVVPAAHHCVSNAANAPRCAQTRLTISFTARVAVRTHASFYEGVIDAPPFHYKPGAAHGCPGYLGEAGTGLGASGPRGSLIAAGQHVTWTAQLGSLPRDCRGAPIHVTIAYVADSRLGQNGIGSERMPSIGHGAVLVGRGATTLPTR
jgi:hypothetical protein